MSRSEQGKNSEPSGPEVSVELRPTAPGNQGRSNAAFQVSRAEGGTREPVVFMSGKFSNGSRGLPEPQREC